MNKLFTRIMATVAGFAMTVGVGAGIGALNNSKGAKPVYAEGETWASNGTAFELATSISAGDQIIIVSNAENNAMGSQSTNNRSAGAVVKAGNTVSNKTATPSAANSVALLTVGTHRVDEVDYFTFAVDGGYLYDASTSSKNYLRTQDTVTDNGYADWTVSINASGIASITARSAAASKYVLSYNTGSDLFACYGSLQSNGSLEIYKKPQERELSGIAVATAPTKTTYYAGEFFDPTGLVIQRTYTTGDPDTYSYSGHESDFSFEPSTTTALTQEMNSVSISYGGQSTTQSITVNAARTITGVTLLGDMTNKSYIDGDDWDLSGLYLSVEWSAGTPNPTTINLTSLTKDTDYILDKDSASEGDTTLTIVGAYEGFDFEKTVTGITVEEHPLADVINSSVVPAAAIGSGTSSWGTATTFSDYTGAIYTGRFMGPSGSSYIGRLNDSNNGGVYTSTVPNGMRIKSISISAIAASKSVGVYAQNTAYTGFPSDKGAALTTLTPNNLSYTFEDEYRAIAIRGHASSCDIGVVTITYEEVTPALSASPSSFELMGGASQAVEITATHYFGDNPTLAYTVLSGSESISSVVAGDFDELNKATVTINVTNTAGTAVVRVKDASNDAYFVDITVTVASSVKTVIENSVTTNSVLSSYDYEVENVSYDNITRSFITAEGENYTSWSESASSGAVYAGNTYIPNETAIQIRSNNDNSGIVTTTSGGTATMITVSWNGSTQAGRVLNVYGKHTAYESPADLYSNSTQGASLGTIVKGTSTSLNISGDYEYIGIRSNDGAIYLDSINVRWGVPTYSYSNVTTRFGGLISKTLWNSLEAESHIEGVGVFFSNVDHIDALENANSIKECFEDAMNDSQDVDLAIEHICNVDGIINRYGSVSEALPAEDGDNYKWNLVKKVSQTYFTKEYEAVAYIRTVDGLVFLRETTATVKQLAQNLLDSDPTTYNANYRDGSLSKLANW